MKRYIKSWNRHVHENVYILVIPLLPTTSFVLSDAMSRSQSNWHLVIKHFKLVLFSGGRQIRCINNIGLQICCRFPKKNGGSSNFIKAINSRKNWSWNKGLPSLSSFFPAPCPSSILTLCGRLPKISRLDRAGKLF